MIETSRFLSPDDRLEHHGDLMEALIRQNGGAIHMSKLLCSDALGNHMTDGDIKEAFGHGLKTLRFDFEQIDADEAAVFLITND
ncbi:MAG: hypothetical protein JWN82_218 [Candidatus Saccharibacteria bacterium]|nr:hypothetical protein [Candidatus Saccharibacteria bacterium]